MLKKVLVLAYAISPIRGSEYSVAWNYVINMSKDNELVVLYGTSGNHMGDIDEMEQYVKTSSIPNVRFIAIKPNKIANALNSLNKRGILVYTFYLAYNIWHRQVYQMSKKIVAKEHFDLIHFLGPIGYREPGYLWKINLPYIWGPIGGTMNVSTKLFKALPLGGKIKLGIRAIINYFQLRVNPNLKRVLNRVDILITATTTDQNNFKNIYEIRNYYLPENGIPENFNSPIMIRPSFDKMKVVWIGQIDARKALIILLESLKRIKDRSQIEIHIVGDGKLKNSLIKFSEENDLVNSIVWHGAVKREKVFEILMQSHLHAITSVTEANTTVIFEAMSVGVPTISLDHCGMHDTICEKCGIKIEILSYEQIIADLAYHLEYLSKNHFELNKLSEGVIECAKKYTWNIRHDFFNNIYDMAITNWNNRTTNK